MDGPMPKGNPEKKDESSNPLAAFEAKLFAEYKNFVAETKKPAYRGPDNPYA
jgi:hypothetical protein